MSDADKFIRLLRALMVPDERPRILPVLFRRRRRVPPPILGLVNPDGNASDLLVETDAWLRRAYPRAVPRILLDLTPEPTPQPDPEATTRIPQPDGSVDGDPVDYLLPLLDDLCAAFTADNTSMGPIEFPRYRTASWLTRQHIRAGIEAESELRRRLPQLLRPSRPPVVEGGDDEGPFALPGVLGFLGNLLTAVLLFAPVVHMWAWVSGRIPGWGRESRWFMGQRYLAPGLSNRFLGFAVRLTLPRRDRENREQVTKLLVHAFLEDLRVAYRRRLLQPSSWRRTAYPVVLLDGVRRDSAADRLLRAVNDIRNETGLFDPLTLVATVHYQPQDQVDVTVQPGAGWPAGEPAAALSRWSDGIERNRRTRDPSVWMLWLDLPVALTGAVGPFTDEVVNCPPAPPWAARRWVVAVFAVTPLIVALAAGYLHVTPKWEVGCTAAFWAEGVEVAPRGGECVGYSDNARQIFSDDPMLIEMQRETFRQNEIAVETHEANRSRPLITLVYFAAFTYTDRNSRHPQAQVEELAGLVLRQREANRAGSVALPLLRVVVANGGAQMRYASWVAEHMLAGLAATDPTVLGVVGLDRSSADTRGAIARLGSVGLPTFATTLSADGLGEASPTYFQAVPSNIAQADLIAKYVAGARYPAGTPEGGRRMYERVTVFRPVEPDEPEPEVAEDLYVTTLADDLTEALRKRDIPVDEFTWTNQAGLFGYRGDCAEDNRLLFFGGRHSDFGAFVEAVTAACPGRAPAILGNDAVTRFITDEAAKRALPANLTLRYVTKGVPAVLGGPACIEGRAELGTEQVRGEIHDLCRGLQDLLSELEEYDANWPGDRTGLAYDVAGVFLQAATRTLGRPHRISGTFVSRSEIVAEMRNEAYQGVTGVMALDTGRLAEGATIGILLMEDAQSTDSPPQCLLMSGIPFGDTSARGPDGCPTGTRSDSEAWQPPSG